MLGSAAQNVIALSDSLFLFHFSEVDFAAIGFAGVFYLVVAAIGFGFSRGGQIMIARRMGEKQPGLVGRTFYAMLYFELALAVVMYLLLRYGAYYFFSLFVNSPEILQKSYDFLSNRAWGIFFSYTGVAIIALYSGVARSTFILIDTVILAVTNIILDYALIFGHWGFPEMGIAGAAVASSVAEALAFVVFFIYILFDKKARTYNLFQLPKVDLKLIKAQYGLALPIVAQAFVGLGSWFIFFSLVENLGERPLAVTNLVRIIYLILSVPIWGFSSGVNTLVSHFIGLKKRHAVFPIVWKTAQLSFIVTLLLSLPVVLFPQEMLYPLLGGSDKSLIDEAQPVLYVLFFILLLFSISGIFFNGLAGTGATMYGLWMQFFCALIYLGIIYVVITYTKGGLIWAWGAEIVYWIIIGGISIYYLKSRKWYNMQV